MKNIKPQVGNLSWKSRVDIEFTGESDSVGRLVWADFSAGEQHGQKARADNAGGRFFFSWQEFDANGLDENG